MLLSGMQRPVKESQMRRTGKKTRYPGIQSLGDGSYRVRLKWRDPKTGKAREVDRTFEGLASPAEASGRREELRAQLEAGELETKSRIRVKDYAHSWLNTKLPTLKPSTANRYATALDLHALPCIGEMYMDAVEHADIIRMRDELAERLAPATVNGALRVLRTMFKDAVVELDLPRDPTTRAKALTEARADDDPNCLTGEQLAQLLAAVHRISPQHYPLFRTLAETGMRISEATSLKWEDIDEKRGVIAIRRSHWRGRVGTTKTNRTRTVPMMPELAQVLAEHRRRLLGAQAPGLAAGWVFPSKLGTLRAHSALNKPLAAALAAAGIEQRFSVHGFRRTFNNLLRQATTGEVVRSMTGHVTERMTEHYSHAGANEKRTAVVRARLHFQPLRWGPRWGRAPQRQTTLPALPP